MSNSLKFAPLVRPGTLDSKGYGKSERHFLDFVIDGESLWEQIGKPIDSIGVLCKEFGTDFVENAVQRLTLQTEVDASNNRRTLFVCAECGDLGCGAITAEIEKSAGTYIWRNFGYENNWEAGVHFEEYQGLGPFEFDAGAYDRMFTNAREIVLSPMK